VDALDSITGQTNFVAVSLSYLNGFLPGNRNWLILPPTEITDDSYMLSWKSAPSQLPRYMDGYTVLVSTTDNFLTSFTDTLFTAASMETIVGDDQSTDFSNFTFTPGYLHADGATLTDYFREGATLHSGLLEPHTVDLSKYEGQKIYIGYLHNSDDDDRLALDDILITKALSTSTIELGSLDLCLEIFPNPTSDRMTVNYELQKAGSISFDVLDSTGSILKSISIDNQSVGSHITNIELQNLASGSYQLRLTTTESQVVQGFIKI